MHKKIINQAYQITISSSEGFECIMEQIEDKFHKRYASYSYFDDEFEENKNQWEAHLVDFAWKSLSRKIEERSGKNMMQNLNHKGAFFEKVDYIFVFVFSIIGPRDQLQEVVNTLTKFKDIDADDFSLVIYDIEKYFSPSYSGLKKDKVWNQIATDGITWPPKIFLERHA